MCPIPRPVPDAGHLKELHYAGRFEALEARMEKGEAERELLRLGGIKIVERLDALEEGGEVGKRIHYPECWDTVAYPTLATALLECLAFFRAFKCTNEDCPHKEEDENADKQA